MFKPSAYSYGADDPSLLDKATSLVQQAAPAVSLAQELFGKTTLEKLAILRAKVANYRRLMKQAPYSVVPGKAWYTSEIAKMQAQIGALEVEAAADASASADYSLWRRLTSAGGVVGIGVGLSLMYLLIRKGNAHG